MSNASSLLLLFALAATSAACQSVEPAPPQQPGVNALAADPLGQATSPCGRYTLRLDHANWRGSTDNVPRLALQMTCVTGEADAFVCGGVRVTDLVSEAGVHWRQRDLEGNGRVHGRRGGVFIQNLKQYERANTAKRIRVECHVMRVFEWRTFDFSCAGPDAEAELICPPFHVGVFGETDGFKLTAYGTDDRDSFPPAQRDLFMLLGHDWVASGATLKDADGEVLQAWGGAGTGGATIQIYGPPHLTLAESKKIRYPVQGTVRLPGRYVVEVVPFEFTDLRLVRE